MTTKKDKINWADAVQEIQDTPYKPGEWEAVELGVQIDLIRKASQLKNKTIRESKDKNSNLQFRQPHLYFEEICRLGLASLAPHQENLSKSPAAHILLEYLQSAFKHYLSELSKLSDENLPTNYRTGILAKSFCIQNKRGNELNEDDAMEIVFAFSRSLHEQLKSVEGPGGAFTVGDVLPRLSSGRN